MGNMLPALSPLRMPELTPAWHYLQLFKQFFLMHDDDLIFILNDEVTVGRFDDFTFDLDANNPWIINYRFAVSVYPDTEFSLLTGGVGRAFLAIKPAMIRDPFASRSPSTSAIDVFEDTYGAAHLKALNGLPSGEDVFQS
jgi:hypothetical protein